MSILKRWLSPVPAELQVRYLTLVDQLVLARLRIVIMVGIPMHLIFSYFDFMLYPHYGPIFLLIRLIDSFLLGSVICLSYFKKFQRFIAEWFGIAYLIVSGGLAVMVWLQAGVTGGFHEGFNIVIIALLFANGFYVGKNIFYALVIWGFYILAALLGHENWDLQKFLFANYFISSTIVFVVIVTMLYSRQHLDAFIKNEKLLENETKLNAMYEQVRQLAITDDLTKIHNRRHFFDLLTRKVAECIREQSYFFIVIFDIDHFKTINDNYGHAVGDQIIEKVAQAVDSTTRKGTLLGRYGGDEFIMMINNASSEALLRRLQEIQNTVLHLDFKKVSELIKVTISIGAAKFDSQLNPELSQVVESADIALLEVKRTNRGGIIIKD